ncbi:MAG: methylenetetrahydrofolate--tRNA-(uracil(54)-C(5))-methyltransferase (FADH(2)-oxidizing) TrmFO [Clostridia bacterium]
MKIKIIGAGLAGCECAYQIAKCGIAVTLIESKPLAHSPVHKLDTYAELVCSNSLKSNDISTAGGLIKQELRLLDSLLINSADKTTVPAGSALAVDREEFSRLVTSRLQAMPNIEIINREEDSILPSNDEIVVVATGPLTSQKLLPSLQAFSGEFLHFYDAVAPIVTAESLDKSNYFIASRYDRGEKDYINCPLTKQQFEIFWHELISAQRATLKDYEKNVFEGCMPIEVMASRGIETIRYGMFKPVGLFNPAENLRPYAVLQLRKENVEGSLYNLVGCQTNLLFGEQKRVFGLIPALANAEFVRYGVMHKNIFINSPDLLNNFFQSKQYPNLFFAGQISGVEGYCESIASGLLCGINIARFIKKLPLLTLDNSTILGALSNYISNKNSNFQPMNANFGILSPLDQIIKDKKAKKMAYAERSINNISKIAQTIKGDLL